MSILFTSLSVFGQEESQLIIIGGGASGTSAGIQATRMGVKTVILEESFWLGGIKMAAGALAGTAILNRQSLQQFQVRIVQQNLLDKNAYLMPFIDIPTDHPHFAAVQKIGATGILRGLEFHTNLQIKPGSILKGKSQNLN